MHDHKVPRPRGTARRMDPEVPTSGGRSRQDPERLQAQLSQAKTPAAKAQAPATALGQLPFSFYSERLAEKQILALNLNNR